MTAIGISAITITLNAFHSNISENLQENAERQVRRIKEDLDRVVKDVNFLAELPSLGLYFSGKEEALDALRKEFLLFNRRRPEYYQIRFIDNNGLEVVRSNHKNNKFFITQKKNLQFKGHRYYFRLGIAQKQGDVYISSIDLNVEHYKVETPNQWVVRVAAPAFYGNDRRGLIVINLKTEEFFKWNNHATAPYTTLFLNAMGEILNVTKTGAPPPIEGYSGVGQHISNIFPELDNKRLISRPPGITSTKSLIFSFNPIGGTGLFRTPTWYLISIFPKSQLNPQVMKLYLNLLIAVLIVTVLGVILGVYLANKFTKPIRQLFMEADLIASGNLDHELEIKTGDEIEDLADKFNKMRLQIKQKQYQLEDWNKVLNKKLDWHISEVRNLERQLYRADKLASLGELSMKLAHEIGNPLASIKTVTQAFSDEYDENSSQPEYMSRIISEVDRLNIFLKQFNNFAVMKEMEPAPCNLRELIRNVNFFLRIQAQENGVTIEENFKDEVDEITVDLQQIKQILINLILNAIQASNRGDIIKITLKNLDNNCVCAMREECYCKNEGLHSGAKEFVELSICDTGVGIPEDNLIRIFDPFFTTKKEGTGLGLSIVHRIVEKHKGVIRVFSKVSKGTTIRLYFPKYSYQEKEAQVS